MAGKVASFVARISTLRQFIADRDTNTVFVRPRDGEKALSRWNREHSGRFVAALATFYGVEEVLDPSRYQMERLA